MTHNPKPFLKYIRGHTTWNTKKMELQDWYDLMKMCQDEYEKMLIERGIIDE